MEDVLGHERAIERLWTALSRGSLHHALLFEGPPGVGKHTVARRLAMAANCTGSEPRPCGKCPTCRQIAAGNHPDVTEVVPDPEKATPTISVDQVREVVRQAGYHRFGARRRFVIVDPAEAMLPSAANALLKTLEEPPQATHFVLVATRTSALLPTILSRCQRVRFGPVPVGALTPWLAARGLEDPAGLARVAEGCPGRALSLADSRLQLRRDLRAAVLNAVAGPLGAVFDLSKDVCEGSGRQEWTARVEVLLEVLEDLLRDVAVRGSGSDRPLVNADLADVVDKWTDALWPGGVAVLAKAIADAREDMLANVSGRTLVDALLTRLRDELGPARSY